MLYQDQEKTIFIVTLEITIAEERVFYGVMAVATKVYHLGHLTANDYFLSVNLNRKFFMVSFFYVYRLKFVIFYD